MIRLSKHLEIRKTEEKVFFSSFSVRPFGICVSIDTLKHLVVLRLIRLLIGWVVSAYILFIMLRDVNSLI